MARIHETPQSSAGAGNQGGREGRRGKTVSRQLQIKTAAVPSGNAALEITVENTRAVFCCNTTQLGSPAH